MQYLLLIYDTEKQFETMPKDELGAFMSAYNDFTAGVKKTGHLVGSNRLHPIDRATTVRIRDGKQQITDGPFAETREQLGGYYLIEANNLDEATAIAARIPSAKTGSIEIRPVWEMK
ncbi:MAG TPA: YciI family protein [Kofleriaceae bacterium]|nr:YciI family protein [Kofleriaceae bacterium]